MEKVRLQTDRKCFRLSLIRLGPFIKVITTSGGYFSCSKARNFRLPNISAPTWSLKGHKDITKPPRSDPCTSYHCSLKKCYSEEKCLLIGKKSDNDGSHEGKAHSWLSLDFFLLCISYFEGVSWNNTWYLPFPLRSLSESVLLHSKNSSVKLKRYKGFTVEP